jgi:hypothetical protein
MKEYYIEINEQQPLELIEKRLQEMGYHSNEDWNDGKRRHGNYDSVTTSIDGFYSVLSLGGNVLNKEPLALKPNLSQALDSLEKSMNELKTALEQVRQAIRNEPN